MNLLVEVKMESGETLQETLDESSANMAPIPIPPSVSPTSSKVSRIGMEKSLSKKRKRSSSLHTEQISEIEKIESEMLTNELPSTNLEDVTSEMNSSLPPLLNNSQLCEKEDNLCQRSPVQLNIKQEDDQNLQLFHHETATIVLDLEEQEKALSLLGQDLDKTNTKPKQSYSEPTRKLIQTKLAPTSFTPKKKRRIAFKSSPKQTSSTSTSSNHFDPTQWLSKKLSNNKLPSPSKKQKPKNGSTSDTVSMIAPTSLHETHVHEKHFRPTKHNPPQILDLSFTDTSSSNSPSDNESAHGMMDVVMCDAEINSPPRSINVVPSISTNQDLISHQNPIILATGLKSFMLVLLNLNLC